MADAPLAFLETFGSLSQDGIAVLTNATRSISSIVPNVTLEETHTDALALTDHPVETGAAITDHSFRIPAELEMRVGWSDTTAQSNGYSQIMYQQLLALQRQRTPFTIQTGKRPYQNMLFRSLAVKTDPTSEYSLMVVAGFREIIIVKSASGSSGGTTDDVSSQAPASDPDNQATPQQTAPTTDEGAQSSTGSQFPTIGNDSTQQFGNNPPDLSGSGTTTNPYGDLSGVDPNGFGGQGSEDSASPLTVHPNATSSGGASYEGQIGSTASVPSFAQGEGGAADPYYSSSIGAAKSLPTFAQ